MLNQDGLIALNNLPQNGYSDKEWATPGSSDRSAMYLRLIRNTNEPSAYREIYFMKTYEVPGQLSLTGSFDCGGVVYSNTQLLDLIGKFDDKCNCGFLGLRTSLCFVPRWADHYA